MEHQRAAVRQERRLDVCREFIFRHARAQIMRDRVDGAVGELGALFEPSDLLSAFNQPGRLHYLESVLETRLRHGREEVTVMLRGHRGAANIAHAGKPDASAHKAKVESRSPIARPGVKVPNTSSTNAARRALWI